MTIFERAREIIINPKVTWQIIKEETTDIKQLVVNYAAPLSLIPAVGTLIGIALIGIRMPDGSLMRAPFIEALIGSVVGYVFNLAGLFIGAWIIKILAPTFGAKSDIVDCMKVVVYSLTPVWLVGIFSVVPGLGLLALLGLYGIYLLALGHQVILETPTKKVVVYSIAILVVVWIVRLVFAAVIFGTIYGPMYLRMLGK